MQKKLSNYFGDNPDVTAILNLHSEGLIAVNSIRSAIAAASKANTAGISTEILLVADKVDKTTRELALQTTQLGIRFLEVEFGDLSSSRNAGVQEANGRYLAFLDGDDLWSDNWILEAFSLAEREEMSSVFHPEASLFFGNNVEPGWLVHRDDDTPETDWTSLALRNHWTALSFAKRSLYQSIPYVPNRIELGFGYEDWTWNAEVLSRGFRHRIVTGTVHFVRMRPTSMVKSTQAAGALMSSTQLFRSRLGNNKAL